jgi:hypothetical protein
MKPNKTIADYLAGRDAARLEPVTEKSKLEAFSADCQRRIARPMGTDAADRIRARIELAETEKALAEFNEWPLENRQRFAVEAYLKPAATEICAILRETIVERAKAQPGFISSKLKAAAEITINLFASKTDRHKIYQEREAIEQAAEDAEAVVDAAKSAVRMFEITPDEEHFGAALARVNAIAFPA